MHVFWCVQCTQSLSHCPGKQGGVPAVPLQGFPACRVPVAGSVEVLRTGCSGMLMVQGHSGWMLVTLGCSDLQHREAHGTGVRSQQCGDVISQDEGMG